MDIPIGEFVNGGAATTLLAVVILVLSGKLVPRRHIEDVRRDCQERVTEARYTTDLWRSAYDNSEKRGDILLEQVSELAEQGRTVQHLIESLREVSHIGTTHVDT